MSTYIKGVKLKQGKYGIKFSGKTEEVIAQLKAITNAKGYFNLEINQRKEVGQWGDTHSLKVDEYDPAKAQQAQQPSGELPSASPADDLPF